MEQWEKNYYITSLAGASNGTTYTQQSYKVSDIFPFKWINKKWKEGFLVTSMTTAGNKWGIVMSRDSSYSSQVVEFDFFYPCEGIHRRWENGYRITSAAATEDQAAFILSTSKIRLQDVTQETLRTTAFPSTHVKVNWKKMLASKEKGGLEVSSLFALNRGLMFKWIWRFYTQNTLLWMRVVKAIHGDDGNVRGHVKSDAKSCWLDIEDIWIDGKTLKNRFPRIYSLESCKLITVGAKLAQPSLEYSFRRNPRGGVEQDQFNELSALVHDVSLIPMSDRWKWDLESSGDFSVASVRKIIDDKSLSDVDSKTRWIKYVPIKVNVHAWKVKTDSLPTRFNVSRRGIDIDSIMCAICDNGVETSRHLFFYCCMVRQIVRKITRWWDVPYVEVESYEDWYNWLVNLRISSMHKQMFEGIDVMRRLVGTTYTQQSYKEDNRWSLEEEVHKLIKETLDLSFHQLGEQSDTITCREDYGDYQCENVLSIWPKLKETGRPIKPVAVGEKIKKFLRRRRDMIQGVPCVRDIGFVTFKLSDKWIAQSIHKMLKDGIDTWAPKLPVERVIIHTTSIAGEETIDDRLRRTCIGDTLTRMLEYSRVVVSSSGSDSDSEASKAEEVELNKCFSIEVRDGDMVICGKAEGEPKPLIRVKWKEGFNNAYKDLGALYNIFEKTIDWMNAHSNVTRCSIKKGNTVVYLLNTHARIRKITSDSCKDIENLKKASKLTLENGEVLEKGHALGFHLLRFTE
ncbi:RNA-directed DNA polymerase, eukaryota, reverse transcriptase zinc-binding domain protein, partial [Tanacetum coccineum]